MDNTSRKRKSESQGDNKLKSKRLKKDKGKKEKTKKKKGKGQVQYTPHAPPALYDIRDEKQFKLGLELLHDKGPRVLTQVLEEKEVETAIGLFWDYLEELNPNIRRTDSKTWNNKEWPALLSVGIFKYHGVGQSKFMWYVRTRPGVRKLFEALFGTQALMTSFDGCGVFRGAEHKFQPNLFWPHVDQNQRLMPGRGQSWQAGINLVEGANPDDSSGFMYFDGSEQRMVERASTGQDKDLYKKNGHYCVLPDDHPVVQDSKATAIAIPKGAGFVWDSTTVHANYPPRSSKIQGKLRRLVGYVAMAPVPKDMSADDLKQLRLQRIEAVANAYTTSHWPNVEPKNNQPSYPRHKSFTPLGVPESCFKKDLNADEAALVLGCTPDQVANVMRELGV